jgi:hypothetical protein
MVPTSVQVATTILVSSSDLVVVVEDDSLYQRINATVSIIP